MAETKFLDDSSLATVIDTGSTLADDARAAANYTNTTELDILADFFLQVQYDGGPPAVGDEIAQLFVLPSDRDGTPAYPEGGDGTVGTDDDPQSIANEGVFTSVNPSTTVDEILFIGRVQLYPGINRIVIKNISQQTFDSTWELRMKPYKLQTG